MKAKIILIGALSLITLAGCKIDKKDDNQPALAQPTAKQGTGRVSVIIKAIVHKDDAFQLFYTEDSSLNYNGDLSVVVPVTGSEAVQDIVFSLSDDALPTTLRLDVGENKAQGDMTIESIMVNYYDKKLSIPGKDFTKYFQPNNNMKTDGQSPVIKLVTDDQGIYDPMAYPSGELINSLRTILVK